MSDGLFAHWWRSLIDVPMLPRHPEPADDSTPERVPGLLDEAN
ncbi:hypothetical protein ACBJ59_36630 [Nonomuraea sp. MTCD27]